MLHAAAQGPTEEMLKHTSWRTVFFGKGWASATKDAPPASGQPADDAEYYSIVYRMECLPNSIAVWLALPHETQTDAQEQQAHADGPEPQLLQDLRHAAFLVADPGALPCPGDGASDENSADKPLYRRVMEVEPLETLDDEESAALPPGPGQQTWATRSGAASLHLLRFRTVPAILGELLRPGAKIVLKHVPAVASTLTLGGAPAPADAAAAASSSSSFAGAHVRHARASSEDGNDAIIDSCTWADNGICNEPRLSGAGCADHTDGTDCRGVELRKETSSLGCACLSQCRTEQPDEQGHCVVPPSCWRADRCTLDSQGTLYASSSGTVPCDTCDTNNLGVESPTAEISLTRDFVLLDRSFSSGWDNGVAVSGSLRAECVGCGVRLSLGIEASISLDPCGEDMEYDAGLCYPKCPPDYPDGVATRCYKRCPDYLNNGGPATCNKPAFSEYGRGTVRWNRYNCLARAPRYGVNDCETYAFRSDWYPVCREDFKPVGCCICNLRCPSGWYDGGVFCSKPFFSRGVGKVISFKPTVKITFHGELTPTLTLRVTATGKVTYELRKPVPLLDGMLRTLTRAMAASLGPVSIIIQPTLGFDYAISASMEGTAVFLSGIETPIKFHVSYDNTRQGSPLISRVDTSYELIGPKLEANIGANMKLSIIPNVGLRFFQIIELAVGLAPYVKPDVKAIGSLELVDGQTWLVSGSACFNLFYGLDLEFRVLFTLFGLLEVNLYTKSWTIYGPRTALSVCRSDAATLNPPTSSPALTTTTASTTTTTPTTTTTTTSTTTTTMTTTTTTPGANITTVPPAGCSTHEECRSDVGYCDGELGFCLPCDVCASRSDSCPTWCPADAQTCQYSDDCAANSYCSAADLTCIDCFPCVSFEYYGFSCPSNCAANCFQQSHCSEGDFCDREASLCTPCAECKAGAPCQTICMPRCTSHDACAETEYCDYFGECQPCSDDPKVTINQTAVPDKCHECVAHAACGAAEFCSRLNTCRNCSSCYSAFSTFDGEACPVHCRECTNDDDCGSVDQFCAADFTCKSCRDCIRFDSSSGGTTLAPAAATSTARFVGDFRQACPESCLACYSNDDCGEDEYCSDDGCLACASCGGGEDQPAPSSGTCREACPNVCSAALPCDAEAGDYCAEGQRCNPCSLCGLEGQRPLGGATCAAVCGAECSASDACDSGEYCSRRGMCEPCVSCMFLPPVEENATCIELCGECKSHSDCEAADEFCSAEGICELCSLCDSPLVSTIDGAACGAPTCGTCSAAVPCAQGQFCSSLYECVSCDAWCPVNGTGEVDPFPGSTCHSQCKRPVASTTTEAATSKAETVTTNAAATSTVAAPSTTAEATTTEAVAGDGVVRLRLVFDLDASGMNERQLAEDLRRALQAVGVPRADIISITFSAGSLVATVTVASASAGKLREALDAGLVVLQGATGAAAPLQGSSGSSGGQPSTALIGGVAAGATVLVAALVVVVVRRRQGSGGSVAQRRVVVAPLEASTRMQTNPLYEGDVPSATFGWGDDATAV